MRKNDFFNSPADRSLVKHDIVFEYFQKWTGIMSRVAKDKKLLYIDLYCGPGTYDNGYESLPIQILNYIIKDERLKLSKCMQCVFNDEDSGHISTLKQEVSKIKSLEKLEDQPIIVNSKITKGSNVLDPLKNNINNDLVYTLSFLDPFGYVGISRELIGALINGFGSDCILFFNYQRIITMGNNNPKIRNRLSDIFGLETLENLKIELNDPKCTNKYSTVLDALEESIRRKINKPVFLRGFKICYNNNRNIKYAIVFLTKNFKAYIEMKEIMAKHSTKTQDNSEIPTYEFCPSEVLINEHSIDKLKNDLFSTFEGRANIELQTIREEFDYKKTIYRIQLQKSTFRNGKRW